jgi:hypothetical protein
VQLEATPNLYLDSNNTVLEAQTHWVSTCLEDVMVTKCIKSYWADSHVRWFKYASVSDTNSIAIIRVSVSQPMNCSHIPVQCDLSKMLVQFGYTVFWSRAYLVIDVFVSLGKKPVVSMHTDCFL